MIPFLQELKIRNELLYYFGLLCLGFAVFCFATSFFRNVEVYGVNAWFKPLKFALSTAIFAWSMAWFTSYLLDFNKNLFAWTIIILLGFEIVYIAWMAAKGLTSHFNVGTPFYSAMFSMMALAATLVTFYTAYVGILFFSDRVIPLEKHYLWAIRFGIIIFVIFAFEGFLMGSRMSHSVGLVNDNSDLFILGWSKVVGDLRVAHFIGMHALQVLPLLSWYVWRSTKLTVLFASLYLALAAFTTIHALNGRPLLISQQSFSPPKGSTRKG